MIFRFDNFSVDASHLEQSPDEGIAIPAAQALAIPQEAIVNCTILRRALDARRGGAKFIYNLAVELTEEAGKNVGLEVMPENELRELLSPPSVLPKDALNGKKAAVIGAGPAGLFAALALAEAGVKVTVFERGQSAETRTRDYHRFLETRELDPESNLLFGEGGAGTFSDGKLYTRINDPFCRYVLAAFIAAGAPENIRYLKRPHIGSDRLPQIVENIRRRIENAGGVFRFGSRVETPLTANGRCSGVRLASGEEFPCDAVFCAHGLGGRDFTRTLIRLGVGHELKGFQIGCRILHPQSFVDFRQYHTDVRPRCLGAAEYSLAAPRQDGSGVATFCMCPGGTVVSGTAWPGHLCSNGMSEYARAGKYANSCMVTTIDPKQFSGADAAYAFLDQLETAAFQAGDGRYTMPGQSAAGFLHGKAELLYHDAAVDTGCSAARLDAALPQFLRDALRRALHEFERKMPGFIAKGQFAGVETCVSSPVRFLCSENAESTLPGLFLLGEGAGRAGGIVSAAVDGLHGALGFFMENKK